MSESTIIAWTDHTANFWMGCFKISSGCKNCYAATLTKNRMGLDVWGPASTTTRQAVKGIYANLRAWNKGSNPDYPKRVFVGSLMDWAEDHPQLDPVRSQMWQAIRENRNLHYQMLTKRPERIRQLLPAYYEEIQDRIWLGTSVEDMRVSGRVDHLRNIPAAVRFISYEPALGPLDDLDISGIDWIIYGGESGPGYRPENKDWARVMHRKCSANGTAFFHKQSAGYRTELGIELDGKIVREYPTARACQSATLG